MHRISQIGTDIEDFKCSWLVVKALERCSEEQTKILYVRFSFFLMRMRIIFCIRFVSSFEAGSACLLD